MIYFLFPIVHMNLRPRHRDGLHQTMPLYEHIHKQPMVFSSKRLKIANTKLFSWKLINGSHYLLTLPANNRCYNVNGVLPLLLRFQKVLLFCKHSIDLCYFLSQVVRFRCSPKHKLLHSLKPPLMKFVRSLLISPGMTIIQVQFIV